jgi:tetratricopeptide (TPR) repeat protein
MSLATALRHRWWLAGLVFLLAWAGAGAWLWLRAAPVTPPMPAGIQEVEVQSAIENARHLVLKNPDSAQAWGDLGLLLLAHQFDRDADFCLAQAARLAPKDPMWPYARASIASKNEPQQVVPLLRQATEAGATWPDQMRSVLGLALAEALLAQGELDEAEALCQQELQRSPRHPRVALGLGMIAAARGNREAATEFLSRARESPFARKKATVRLAALARTRGDIAAADAYELEIAQTPFDPPWPDPLRDALAQMEVGRRARDRLVARLEQEGRYAEAAQLYLEQLAKQPTLEAYVGAGLNLSRLKNYDKALPLLRKAAQLDPNSAHAHYPLALALFDRAERALRRWRLSLFGADTASAGCDPLGNGPLQSAAALFPGRIELTPPADPIKAWFTEAREHAQRAAELEPEHADAYLFWGLALKHRGEPQAAIAPLKKGVACRPTSLELQLALGEVLLDNGQLPEASTHLELAHRLDPNDPRVAQALQRLRRMKC